MNRRAFLLLSSFVATSAVAHTADAKMRSVIVATPRITLGQLLPKLDVDDAAIDLGPAPAPNGSRILTKKGILAAIEDAGREPVAGIPKSVRVLRKMRTLRAVDLERITKKALKKRGLKKGMTLAKVAPPTRRKIADGWDTVRIRLPKHPKKPGKWTTSAILSFEVEGERIARVSVRVTFDLTEEATRPDIKKGAPLTLTVRSRRVEVSVKAHAGADADIGDTFAVQLRPSGRVVRAKLVSPSRAIAVGGRA